MLATQNIEEVAKSDAIAEDTGLQVADAVKSIQLFNCWKNSESSKQKATENVAENSKKDILLFDSKYSLLFGVNIVIFITLEMVSTWFLIAILIFIQLKVLVAHTLPLHCVS